MLVEEDGLECSGSAPDEEPADKIIPSIRTTREVASPRCTEPTPEPKPDAELKDAEPKPELKDAEPKPDAVLQGGIETCEDVSAKPSANCDDVKQVVAPCESSLTLRFWQCAQSLLPGPRALVEEAPDASQKKRAQGAAHGSEKLCKRKGKQQQQSLRQKRNAEVSCSSKYGALRDLRWPCSLPLTAALVAMLGIVLVGKTFEGFDFGSLDSFNMETREKDLEAKRQELEQLKRKHASFSLRLALLKLEEFQEDAAGVVETLPDDRKAKVQGIRADAKNLEQALRDIADVEFPQVEASFKSVYAGWQRILRDAQRQEKQPPIAYKVPSFMLQQARPTSGPGRRLLYV